MLLFGLKRNNTHICVCERERGTHKHNETLGGGGGWGKEQDFFLKEVLSPVNRSKFQHFYIYQVP